MQMLLIREDLTKRESPLKQSENASLISSLLFFNQGKTVQVCVPLKTLHASDKKRIWL